MKIFRESEYSSIGRCSSPQRRPPNSAAVPLPRFRDALGLPSGDSEPQPEDTTDEPRMDRALADRSCAGVDLVAYREAEALGWLIVYHRSIMPNEGTGRCDGHHEMVD